MFADSAPHPRMPAQVQLAIGRIFRLGSRPEKPGDAADYERCRAIIMAASSFEHVDRAPNFSRDYRAGRAGQ
jgi:hypothetical protein